jgi:serine/threonine-protein kinase
MSITTAEELAHRCEELGLVSPQALHECWAELGGHNVPIEALTSMLMRRELLTSYQLERLIKGDRTGFLYGRAKVLYQIGAGAFARVYRAIDTSDGRIHAVKVLRSRFSNDAAKCKGFRHEGEMGRLLRHPNIVAIEDVGQEGDASYITMEFVEGQTLRELVKIRGAIDVPRGIDIVRQLASGLEYAHRRGVTHRDLKATNVLVSSTGQAKLVDFGLAGIDADTGDRALGKVDQPRTVDYAALEKACGIRNDAFRSDIFFLGTIAYLVFAGEPALGESRDRSVRSDPRRYSSIVPLATRVAGLPRDVTDAVSRMLYLDPLERWQTAADVVRAFDQLAAKYPIGGAGHAVGNGAGQGGTAAGGEPRKASRGRIMIVENSESTAAKLRKFFTDRGFRVLETESPKRALARFSSTPLPADGLLLSAVHLGGEAVEAFNELSRDPFLAAVPAMLLLGKGQESIAEQAATGAKRVIVKTPIDTKSLEAQLATLFG